MSIINNYINIIKQDYEILENFVTNKSIKNLDKKIGYSVLSLLTSIPVAKASINVIGVIVLTHSPLAIMTSLFFLALYHDTGCIFYNLAHDVSGDNFLQILKSTKSKLEVQACLTRKVKKEESYLFSNTLLKPLWNVGLKNGLNLIASVNLQDIKSRISQLG